MITLFRPVLTLLVLALPAVVSAQNKIEASPPPSLPGGHYALGSTLTLRLEGVADSAADLQWFHEDHAIPSATQLTFTIATLSLADSGNYRLHVVKGGLTTWSNTITVNVSSPPSAPIDFSFKSELWDNSDTRILGVYADGRVLVRHASLTEGAATTTQRLNPDGTVDSSFRFPTSNAFRNAPLLAIYPDGRLVVGTSVGINRLAANGEPTAPLVLPPIFVRPEGLTAAAVQTDGRLLIAQHHQIARLHADDTIDPSFVLNAALTARHTVVKLQLDQLGRIYVSALESDATDPRHATVILLRLLPDGREDATFLRQATAIASVETPPALQLFPLPGGNLLRFDQTLEPSSLLGSNPTFSLLDESGAHISAWSDEIKATSIKQVAANEDGAIFYLESSGVIRRAMISATEISTDPDFYAGNERAESIAFAPGGLLFASGAFPAWDKHPSREIVRLHTESSTTVGAPAVRLTGSLGGSSQLTITSHVTGQGPFTYEWRALDDQPLPPDIWSANLALGAVTDAQLGRYQVRVSNPAGSTFSEVFTLSSRFEPYLAALSGRVMTGTEEDTAIAGFTFRGSFSGMIRGVGPSLAPLGLSHFLRDPLVRIFDRQGRQLHEQDNWSDNLDVAAMARNTGAHPLIAGSKDAALLFRTAPTTPSAETQSAYTIHLLAADGQPGVALLEICSDATEETPDQFPRPAPPKGLSLRARTSPGEGTAIAGFVISDPANLGRSARVLLRISGPALARHGVAQPLSNPVLKVFNSAGTLIAENDDWFEAVNLTELKVAARNIGLAEFAPDSGDSAMLLDVPAGAYTLHAAGGIGVVLLEIYIAE